MQVLLVSLLIFLGSYLINSFYITAFYHRGLAHRALDLGPKMTQWVAATGPWATGIDPKAWIAMHRLHHTHSDTDSDPHSPLRFGVLGVAIGQLKSYEAILIGLLKGEENLVKLVKDLPFDVHYLNRKGIWWMPYVLHLSLAVALSLAMGHPLFGIAFYLGIMSHPIQGWMVNSFAHKYGYRNFDLPDNSRNNALVAWLVVGEGFQNNHHALPSSANFAVKSSEIDLGYFLCQIGAKLNFFNLPERNIPTSKTLVG